MSGAARQGQHTLSVTCSSGGSRAARARVLSLAKLRLKSKLREPSSCHVFQPSCSRHRGSEACLQGFTHWLVRCLSLGCRPSVALQARAASMQAAMAAADTRCCRLQRWIR